MDEARDTLAVQVVDTAIPAEKPVRPKKILVTVIAVGVSFFIALFVALVLGIIERSEKNPDNKAKIDTISNYFSFWKKTWRRIPFRRLLRRSSSPPE